MTAAAHRLVIFDVDGTLLDSQDLIVRAMGEAFAEESLAAPRRADVLGIVGLSLPEAMRMLLPRADGSLHDRLVTNYKAAFLRLRQAGGAEGAATLYPGAREALVRLEGRGYRLGIATGKARRGVEHFLAGHDLAGLFCVTQTADDAPSKPHPGMVLNCLDGARVAAGSAVIVGDTEFDMHMGRSAGVRRIGVGWGYHPRERIRRGGAEAIAEHFDELDHLIERLWAA